MVFTGIVLIFLGCTQTSSAGASGGSRVAWISARQRDGFNAVGRKMKSGANGRKTKHASKMGYFRFR